MNSRNSERVVSYCVLRYRGRGKTLPARYCAFVSGRPIRRKRVFTIKSFANATTGRKNRANIFFFYIVRNYNDRERKKRTKFFPLARVPFTAGEVFFFFSFLKSNYNRVELELSRPFLVLGKGLIETDRVPSIEAGRVNDFF